VEGKAALKGGMNALRSSQAELLKMASLLSISTHTLNTKYGAPGSVVG
jgi:hypothetical protein